MQSSKYTSKNTNATASAANTPAGSRRASMHDNSARVAKTDQQIRDEVMQIMMTKCILVHPSQPFVFK
ncbi:hypothetical protein BG011_001788 [Mortierella polycephala]|uniref:Uncharacterized protein n=1 Tax=Mortierella polycephala TaxID=41804 RepID=A0A9P6QFA1_9FUNG|nr:hypothetical protein BG011_001788 [Mortierella polycephala]